MQTAASIFGADEALAHISGAEKCGSAVDKHGKSLNAKHEKRLPVF